MKQPHYPHKDTNSKKDEELSLPRIQKYFKNKYETLSIEHKQNEDDLFDYRILSNNKIVAYIDVKTRDSHYYDEHDIAIETHDEFMDGTTKEGWHYKYANFKNNHPEIKVFVLYSWWTNTNKKTIQPKSFLLEYTKNFISFFEEIKNSRTEVSASNYSKEDEQYKKTKCRIVRWNTLAKREFAEII